MKAEMLDELGWIRQHHSGCNHSDDDGCLLLTIDGDYGKVAYCEQCGNIFDHLKIIKDLKDDVDPESIATVDRLRRLPRAESVHPFIVQ